MIKRNKEAIYPGEGTIDLLENMDLDIQRPVHIYDMLDGERQQQESDDLMAGAENDPQFESFAYTGNLDQDGAQGGNGFCESSKYRIVNVPKEDELSHRTRRLVPEQMNILRRVCAYCRDVVKSRKSLEAEGIRNTNGKHWTKNGQHLGPKMVNTGSAPNMDQKWSITLDQKWSITWTKNGQLRSVNLLGS